MIRSSFLTWAAAIVVPLVFSTGLRAQQATAPPEKAQSLEAAAAAKVEVGSEKAGSTHSAYSDEQLAAMLILQHAKQRSISQFAAEHADNAKVKSYALKMALEHGNFVTKLHQDELVQQDEPKVGQVLQDLAQQIRQRREGSDEDEAVQPRVVLGFRGDEEESDAPAATNDEQSERQEVRQLRQTVREERQDVRQARRPGRDDVRDEVKKERAETDQARDELRETRQEVRDDHRLTRRENARQFMRDVLPVLRDNLPAILDMVGEAVEEHSARQGRGIELHKQFVERHTKTIKNDPNSSSSALPKR